VAATNGAIVLGGHIQALGIIRILGRLGIKSIIIDKTRNNITRHSRFCSGFYKSKDSNLLSLLFKLGFEKKFNKWIIFPTNDFHVKLLSINKGKLEEYFIVSTDNWEVVRNFYNKCYTYELVGKLKIPFPETWFPKSEKDLTDISVSYPCLIKPAVMHDFYSKTKKKVLVCHSEQELYTQYRKAAKIVPSEEILIQEIIPGGSKNQVSACFLFLKGEKFIYLTASRMRQHPTDFGNATTYAETIRVKEIIDYAISILKAVNYNGLCEVEFKKDERDGLYKLLEVNPRTWKWHSIANKTDTPFIECFFNFLNGRSIDYTDGFKDASFLHRLTDFPVRLKLLLKGYPYWNKKAWPCEYAVWSKDDILPSVFEIVYLPYNLLTR